MRPFVVLCSVMLIAVAAFSQVPHPSGPYGPCLYGCAPFVPMISTPMISLQQYSPNPVGASNATTGLTAGATNSTLSQVEGSTSSTYTVPVWYQGGAPLVGPGVNLYPEPLGREAHTMHHPMGDGAMREHGAREEEHAWVYFTGYEHTSDAASAGAAAKAGRKATHVYTNDDITRQNDKNGAVKYDGKTEKM